MKQQPMQEKFLASFWSTSMHFGATMWFTEYSVSPSELAVALEERDRLEFVTTSPIVVAVELAVCVAFLLILQQAHAFSVNPRTANS